MAGTARWLSRELFASLRNADAGGGAGAGDGESAQLSRSAVSAAFGAITVFLVRLAVRARRRKSRIGADAMVGYPATAMEALDPAAG